MMLYKEYGGGGTSSDPRLSTMLYKEYGGGGTSSDPRRDIATATPIVVVWRNLLKKYFVAL